MKQVVHDLIQAVRDLGLELTDKEPPKCIRITGDPSEFWSRLRDLQLALHALDRDGAASSDVETPQPQDNPEKLKMALDGLMRLFQIQGGNLSEATEVIQSALGVEEKENDKRNTFDTLPNFAPEKLKRRRGYKFRFNLMPEKNSEITFDKLRKMNFEVMQARRLLGSTVAPIVEPRPEIPSLSKGR